MASREGGREGGLLFRGVERGTQEVLIQELPSCRPDMGTMQGRGLGGVCQERGGPGGSRQWGWCMAGGEVWDGGHASALSALNENEKGTGHKLEMQGGEGRRGQRC